MFIDECLESYKTFFDHDWARRIMDVTAGTKLDDCVFSLCVNWKAAANTHIVPWFVVTSMAHFAAGMTKSHEPLTVKIIKATAARLLAEMGDSLRNMQRKKLSNAIDRIGKEVCEGLERQEDQEELKPEFYWQMYLGSQYPHEFRLIVWGSQRICYGAVYHAYEDFIRGCVRIASCPKTHAGYSGHRKLMDEVEKHFGQQVAQDCLNAPEVRAARLVRNALAHNGGKETDELKKIQHGIRVEGGVLQIMAPDTRRLFDVLKDRAYKLVEKALALPNMR
jgi:hypothetical protein